MCGIAGIWHRSERHPVERDVLSRMAEVVRHRGPDDAGYYYDRGFGLAHRRLSILDLSAAGRQPMTTADGRFTISFNGEIYNYRELARQYCSDIKLRSSSDTEVLLYLLAQKWDKGLKELRGMFALALWDRAEQRLLLARDPFGKKPLYYAQRGDTFLFASEVKSLLATPWVERELDRAALAKYFLYEYVPSPATGYRGIQQLPMGHAVIVAPDSLSIQRWWTPRYHPTHSFRSEQEACSALDEKLARAVRRRMISDVPVGVLLSGGLDSTTITWYMRQATAGSLHSFSASFDEASFDESRYAQLAAEALGTTHHRLQFGVPEFRESIAALIQLMDVPFGDASLLPTLAVCRLARSFITVALDGDGSDELLGGYGTFQAAEVADWLPPLPASVTALLRRAAGWLPTNYDNFSLDFKIKSFVEGLSYPRARRNQIWLGSFTERGVGELLQPEWRLDPDDLFDDVSALEEASERLGSFDSISWLKIHHYLQNDILVKLDRASMFVSLEARTPFLDVELAEFIMRLPSRLKREKYLLKRLMRGRIPAAIIDRPKRGFGVPVGHWLRGPLRAWAREVLHPDKLRSEGIFNPLVVERLFAEHTDGKADHRKKLWTLIAWQLWHDHWVR
jgi:asparagine synthase (glutamine-hydrolysing)